jgi:hypothetical protein
MAALMSPQQRVIAFDWENTVPAIASKNANAAPAPQGGAAANALPINVKMEVNFGAAGGLDAVSKTADEFMSGLKIRFSRYDVVAEPFPWVKEETQQEEIELGIEEVDRPVTNPVAVFRLVGLKAADAAVAGQKQGGAP